MANERGPDWMRTLDEVEQAVRGCLDTLDRYEARFGEFLAEAGAARPPASPDQPRPEPAVWDARLDAARAEADAVERLLAEQEAVWGRWRESFSAWRQSLEQPPGPTAPAGG